VRLCVEASWHDPCLQASTVPAPITVPTILKPLFLKGFYFNSFYLREINPFFCLFAILSTKGATKNKGKRGQ